MMSRTILIAILQLFISLSMVSLNSIDHKDIRHSALLTRDEWDHSGQHYSSHDAIDYSYTEENNELFLTGYTRAYNEEYDTPVEHFFHMSHGVVYENGLNTYYYHVYNDSTPNFVFENAYSIDSENRLTYLKNGSEYSETYFESITKFINPVSSVVDSIITVTYSIGQFNFKKYTYNFDNQNRPILRNKYTSTDSLNWAHSETCSVAYGDPLPYALNLEQPETYNYIYNYMVSPDYKITESSRSDYQNGLRTTYYYLYMQNTDYLDIIITRDTTQWMTWYDGLRFDLNGRLLEQSIVSYVYGTNESHSFNFTWGEYTSTQDETTSTPNISIFPNPMDKYTIIRLDSIKSSKSADISIYNIKGQLIRQWNQVETTEQTWNGTDMNNFPVGSGLYLIRVKQGNISKTMKVMRL